MVERVVGFLTKKEATDEHRHKLNDETYIKLLLVAMEQVTENDHTILKFCVEEEVVSKPDETL